ncbi:Uncharacterised protein [uncultured archaeon]|nr:Uncharacterised protein [uncultured archaeon]
MRLVILAVVAILMFSIIGCVGPQNGAQPQGPGPARTALNTTDRAQAGGIGSANAGAGTGESAGAGAATGAATAPQFSEWKAPDGSITLQVPQGWQVSEKQIDNCTVNWAVTNPAGTSSVYMNNQVMAFKSEDAKQIYKAYGLAGTESVPVSGYLGAEEAVKQIIAPLTGASDVSVTYRDDGMSKQFSQGMCIAGLAACDGQVFEAVYKRNGVLMRGKYMVLTFDMGDGSTWWTNIWGYTSPAADWNNTAPLLESVFASAKYTDAWTARCSYKGADPGVIINDVIKNNQAASERAAAGWDNYIRGG